MTLRRNPRLIQLDTKWIRNIAQSWCKAIAKEAEDALQSADFAGWEDEPLALLAEHPVWGREYEVATRTKGREKKGIRFRLHLEPAPLSPSAQRHVADGGDLSCNPGTIVGGHIQAWEGVRMRDLALFSITVEVCPTTTLGLLSAAGASKKFQDDVYSVLIHELTHASEFGAPDEQKVAYSTPKEGGSKADYYNHPWELNAHARQIANEVLEQYEYQRKVDRARALRKRAGQKVPKLSRDKLSPGEVLDLYLEVSPVFNRVWPHLTKANQKRLLQMVAREVQEEGFE